MKLIQNPFPVRAGNDTPAGRLRRQFIFLLTIFGLAFCITVLYHGSRVIMRMGGMVARGGPYEIAHPAPGWVWIMPVSIIAGLVFFFVNLAVSGRLAGPNLMFLAWSALFLSLGWNFMEFGLFPPGGSGLVWGWLICGFFFIPMGGLPLYYVVREFRKNRRELSRAPADRDSRPAVSPKGSGLLLLQLAAVLAGIYLGRLFFMAQAYPQRPASAAAAAAEKQPPALEQPAGIELRNGGRILTLAVDTDGIWKLIYERQFFRRSSELPAPIKHDFTRALDGLRDLLK